MELLIRNGFVYDPANHVNGEQMDIAVRDGKIVSTINERKAKKIDAARMIVMPGGVDIHSHIAGSEVNMGRLLRPEDHRCDVEYKTSRTRSGVGCSVPSTFATGYRYSRMGYTTVMNPSMPPLEARHTHEELNDTPMIDKGTYPLLGDWWFLLEYLRDNRIDDCARHIAWMMTATKGYAIKIVNPGGLESWGFGHNVDSLDDPVSDFGITPREVIRGLCRANRLVRLPHTIHVHTNNLGRPGNYQTTLETMKSVEDLSIDGQPAIHITHCQFSAFKGEDWATMESGASEIADYVNGHSHVTLDMGQVVFGDTTTMTADGPFQYGLHQLNGGKWVNHDVETETSGGIVPFHYRRKNYVNAVQWSIGLELALLIKDPWKIFMTTDHPNGAPFTSYPRIIAWLISKKAREATLRRINRKARSTSLLPSLDRELDFYELAVVTRAGQAKALGLKDKGNLGIDADADIAIYGVDPKMVDPTNDYRSIRRAFGQAAYTVKDGRIVVRNGEIVKSVQGSTLWIDAHTSDVKLVTDDMERRFKDYWTVDYNNYPVSDDYLRCSHKITVQADV